MDVLVRLQKFLMEMNQISQEDVMLRHGALVKFFVLIQNYFLNKNAKFVIKKKKKGNKPQRINVVKRFGKK